MTRNRIFWILLSGATLLLYLFIIAGSCLIHQPKLGWLLIGLLILLHLIELRTALRIGRPKGVPTSRILFMNMLFGFIYWVPLRMGVFEQ